jgi:L-alanine-DL-glutamate epimerase-like enolase superfamily enzyme
MGVQVDANNSYPAMNAIPKLIKTLNDCQIDVIEDLFPVGAVEECCAACRELKGKYMVDKDAHWPHVQKIIAEQAAELINQHPHNQGRVSYALKIAETAMNASIQSAIGASGIFGIQNTCYQQLAAVIGLTRPCEDIGMYSYYDTDKSGSFHFSARPSVLQFEHPIRDGHIQLNKLPGIGVEVDQQRLAFFAKQQKVFTR